MGALQWTAPPEMGAFKFSKYLYHISVKKDVIFVSAQIDAVGGDHNLLMPSLHEQIRGVDQIIRHKRKRKKIIKQKRKKDNQAKKKKDNQA